MTSTSTSKHFQSQAGFTPPHTPSPPKSPSVDIPSSNKTSVSKTDGGDLESSESSGIVPSFSPSPRNSMQLLLKETQEGMGEENWEMDLFETSSSELVPGSITSVARPPIVPSNTLGIGGDGSMQEKDQREEKETEFNGSQEKESSEGGDSSDSANTVLEISTKQDFATSSSKVTSPSPKMKCEKQQKSSGQDMEHAGASSAAFTGEETSASEDRSSINSEDPNCSSGYGSPVTPSHAIVDRHTDAYVNCCISLTKLRANEPFQIYKKQVVIKRTLEVALRFLPHVDHDNESWHCLLIQAGLLDELLGNVQHGHAKADIVTKTKLKGVDGQMPDFVVHKRRRFKTGHLNYLCRLVRADTLLVIQGKHLDICIKFEVYAKVTDLHTKVHYDNDEDMMVIDGP